MSPAHYLLALCSTAMESGISFGLATRIGSSNPTFKTETTKVVHSILTFSPAPDTVTTDFLNDLEKGRGMSFLVRPVLDRTSQFDCATWTKEVIRLLSVNFTKDERPKILEPLTDRASEMLSHLLIATRNPGGKKTPQQSVHSTPDTNNLRPILNLLDEATTQSSQSALMELLFWRDGFLCPFTGFSFTAPGRHVSARSAHILPFSFQDKPLTLKTLETFTGRQLAPEVIKHINHPCNAFNAEKNAHYTYDKLAWGIEAVQDGNQWRYFFREVRSDEISSTIKLSEGQEIVFHRGPADGQVIQKPEPSYCNIKLAIARAMHACGASGIISEMYGDDDDDEAIVNQPVYLGGPFVSDEVLLRRLDDRLLG